MASRLSFQRELVFLGVVIVALFALLALRDGGNYYVRYLHQDASRAQFEIDESYVLMISQAEEGDSNTTPRRVAYESSVIDAMRKSIEPPPATGISDYELARSIISSSYDEDVIALERMLDGKRDGFYVLCCQISKGGLTLAANLHYRGWMSMVMESDYERFQTLKDSPRRYFIVNAALPEVLNTTMDLLNGSHSHQMRSEDSHNNTGDNSTDKNTQGPHRAGVIPLDLLAQGLERKKVDLLVLSSQGNEYAILKVLPFDTLEIDMIKANLSANADVVTGFLGSKGYKRMGSEGSAKGMFQKRTQDGSELSSVLERLRQAKLQREIVA